MSVSPDRSHVAAGSEPLADARVRPLLERYAATAGAELLNVADGLVELRVPPADRAAFRNRDRVRIAFTVEALEQDPEAEIAVVGGALVEQLVAAIRLHGARVSYGLVPPTLSPAAEAAELRTPITNGSVGVAKVDIGRHRIVRLLARVVVRAGSTIDEHLVESGCFDATTGAKVPDDVAEECARLTRIGGGEPTPTDPNGEAYHHAPLHSVRPTTELVSLALAELRTSLEPRIQRLRDEARLALGAEIRRIDGYYTSLLRDSGGRGSDVPDEATRRAYETEHARRRTEEERRHQVRAVVHPVQLTEWELIVQRAQWELTTNTGKRGRLIAQRALTGEGAWTFACPGCGTSNPSTLTVCKSEHVACETCALTCGVCAESFCWDHGIAACHVDGRPTCREHARSCTSCREPYCTTHEALCADGDHPVCTECLAPCAICSRRVCKSHASVSAPTAPRGSRRLCSDCVRFCEGGTSEPVGRDEVVRCSSCEKSVCETHRSTCAVDQQVHCSKHLWRTDGSRRLVCETHRDACAFEPGAVLASDEVAPCASCGQRACTRHSHACVEDGHRFCAAHSVSLQDRAGEYACHAHHSVCHVDQQTYSLGGTASCPVCDRAACKAHRRRCGWCGRDVCTAEFNAAEGRCGTCLRLTRTEDPADSMIAAANVVLGDRPLPRTWKTGRDAQHTVVELDLGWTRRVVFVIRHGDARPSGGRSHSLLGSSALSIRA